MKLDAAFFGRVKKLTDDKHRASLKVAVLAQSPVAVRDAMSATIDKIWADAVLFKFSQPTTYQKYVLIYLTQSKWMKNKVHLAYAARMMGTPNQNWNVESGVLAMYANVLATHYLALPLITFIEKEEKLSA